MVCIDAPCCGCCDPAGELASPELVAEMNEADMEAASSCCDCYIDGDESIDGDHETAMASAGTDEDYRCDMHCEGYDEY